MATHPQQFESAVRRPAAAALVGAAVLVLASLACNKQASLSNAPQGNANSGNIIAAGSTFIYPAMTRWISTFQGSHPGVQIKLPIHRKRRGHSAA